MNEIDYSQPEYWIDQTLTKMKNGDFNKARIFSEKAYILSKPNLDLYFLYFSNLIKIIPNSSLNRLELNLEKANELLEKIKKGRKSKLFNFTENQNKLFMALVDEHFEFYEYVENKKSRLDIESYL